MRLPIRARLTLVFASMMAAVLAGSTAMLYVGVAAQLDATIDHELRELTGELAADVRAGNTGKILDRVGIVAAERSFAQILDREGRLLEVSQTLADGSPPLVPPGALKTLAEPRFLSGTVRTHKHPEPEPARLLATPTPEGSVIVVGAELEERNTAMASLAAHLVPGALGLLLVGGALAWVLAGMALRPVERMRQETLAISEGDLERRLPVPPAGDELARLAITFNQMLARLAQAFERERRFVDDASHEMRTPLATLKTELEMALGYARTVEEFRAALVSAVEESERLNRLTEDLLLLSRAERDGLALDRQSVNASALVSKAIRIIELRAREREIAIHVSAADIEVVVDELRVEQALVKLLENAVLHTPRGGALRVAVTRNTVGDVVFEVADTGHGFPDAFIDRAFDPFARAEAGRSRKTGGTGLGLAVVKAIVEAHGGTAETANRHGEGAIVSMRIPQITRSSLQEAHRVRAFR